MKGLFIFVAILLPSIGYSQKATVSGKIIDGTTGKPVSVERVALMKPGQFGMEMVAALEGVREFVFRDLEPSPGIPYIIRTSYRDISYSVNVTMTEAKAYVADLTVYQDTKKWTDTHVRIPHMIIVREGDHLQIEQTLEFHNGSKFTYQGDSLRIAIPETAHGTRLTTSYQDGLALPAMSAVNGNHYAIALPLRPGSSRIQLSYEMEYDAAGTTLRQPLNYDISELNIFVSPRDMELEAQNVVQIPDEELARNDFAVFQRQNLSAGDELTLRLRGGSAVVRRDVTDVVAEDNAVQKMIWLVLPLTLGLLSFGLYFGLSKTSGERERLIKEIAALDDSWLQKGMADKEYRKKRSALKTELREHL